MTKFSSRTLSTALFQSMTRARVGPVRDVPGQRLRRRRRRRRRPAGGNPGQRHLPQRQHAVLLRGHGRAGLRQVAHVQRRPRPLRGYGRILRSLYPAGIEGSRLWHAANERAHTTLVARGEFVAQCNCRRCRTRKRWRKCVIHARAAVWFLRRYQAAKARVEFAPGGVGAQKAAASFASVLASVDGSGNAC